MWRNGKCEDVVGGDEFAWSELVRLVLLMDCSDFDFVRGEWLIERRNVKELR